MLSELQNSELLRIHQTYPIREYFNLIMNEFDQKSYRSNPKF
ncbi:hypothetical protein LEP1GSC073_1624 [Leptospira noguchii str. Cascata]|nr:hypothetical protein LEP1GSC073_1624 [Leptospira noguchii str. Cascata]